MSLLSQAFESASNVGPPSAAVGGHHPAAAGPSSEVPRRLSQEESASRRLSQEESASNVGPPPGPPPEVPRALDSSSTSMTPQTQQLSKTVDARLRDIEERLHQSVDEKSSGMQSAVVNSSIATPHGRLSRSLVELAQNGPPLSGKAPLQDLQMDLEIVKEGLQRAVSVVRAAEYSIKGQLADYHDCMEAQLEVQRRSEQKLAEELRQRSDELLELQNKLEAERAAVEAETTARGSLLEELAKANEAVTSSSGERQNLQDELEQVCSQVKNTTVEINAARMREEALEETLASLQHTERGLRKQLAKSESELQATQAELAKSESELREELAEVQDELHTVRLELQRRQKCCYRLRSKPKPKPYALRSKPSVAQAYADKEM